MCKSPIATRAETSHRREPAKVLLIMPSCLLPAPSGPIWAEQHSKGTTTARNAHVLQHAMGKQRRILCVMSQELHRDLVPREQWGQGMKTFNENPADDILFSFSSNCHCLKPKSHFCLFLPCLSVLFVCFCHVLPNCFFFPFLFFSCLKKKTKKIKFCISTVLFYWCSLPQISIHWASKLVLREKSSDTTGKSSTAAVFVATVRNWELKEEGH